MVEVNFYSIKSINFVKELIKTLQQLLVINKKIDLLLEESAVEEINSLLWSYDVFFPHCVAADKYANKTPVVLFNYNNYQPTTNYVVLVNNASIEVTNNLSIIFNATQSNYLSYNRERYKTLKDKGINVNAVNIV